MIKEEYDWMEEAKAIVDECSTTETLTKNIAMWIQTAALNQKNTDYYRGLLYRCGKAIGDRAYIADDGTRSQDVLCAKIPEIIEQDYIHDG